ncbi:zinc finger (CCCH type) protein, putative [Eimeria tenella]|uniref:Zinc finger (CCCH type) protein, putative n=1 Tax=Eimeria tenella TaxID=5802 RepID=U6KQ26_EIMTE|nr:zinc finger (CCCH type) protein, putative [Eimeria tenella]CDJ39013.1 zinc finger (CCCH type) protein, putative [Eimeria tenella]|eukprot:XP_013229768.1 zinc finger (CCCH type) protein, putative [Eimeria tenella]
MSYSASSAQRGLTSPSGVSDCSDSTNVGLLTAGMDRSCEDTVSLSSHSTVSSFPGSRPSPGDERRSSSTPSGATDQPFDSTTDLKNQLLSLSHPLLSCLPLEHTIVADRRRVFHKTQLCRHLASGYCRNGLDCPFAHSETELRPAPHLSKTMMCPAVKAGGLCPRVLAGGNCSFAHSRHELRRTANHYKTNMCRSWLSGNCLKDDKCTHAHGEIELLFYRHRALQSGRRDFLDERETARIGKLPTLRSSSPSKCSPKQLSAARNCIAGPSPPKKPLAQQPNSGSFAGSPPRKGYTGSVPAIQQIEHSSRKSLTQQPPAIALPAVYPASPDVLSEAAALLQLASQLQALALSQSRENQAL